MSLKISETYIVGVDITDNDVPTITIVTQTNNGMDFVNAVTGDKAVELYELLTNKKFEKGNN